MAAWNALFFQRDAFRPDLSQSAEWNRGAYLVQGLAHCGACHTPKRHIWRRRAERRSARRRSPGMVRAEYHRGSVKGSRPVECRGHRRLPEVRPQCGGRRDGTDGRRDRLLQHQYDRLRPQGHRDLSQVAGRSKRRVARADRRERYENDGRRVDLRGAMLRLPRIGRQGRPGSIPGVRALAAAACGGSGEPHPCGARRRADRFDGGRADGPKHAVVRLEAQRRGDRRRSHLCPQQLGPRGACRDPGQVEQVRARAAMASTGR